MRSPLPALAIVSLLLPTCSQTVDVVPAGTLAQQDGRADALLAQARNEFNAGKTSKAKAKLKVITNYHKEAPCTPDAYLLLGDIFMRTGDYNDAFKQYDAIVKNYQGSPLYEQALNKQLSIATAAASGKIRGHLFYLWDTPIDSGKTMDWLRTIISNAPYAEMAATASCVLGEYLVRRRKYDEACEVYKNLVEHYPESKYAPGAQLMCAELLAGTRTRGNNNQIYIGRAQEAYEEFSLLFADDARNAEARAGARRMQNLLIEQELQVGIYYLERAREYTAAKFCFENVIRRRDQNPEAARRAQQLLARTDAILTGNGNKH